MIPDDRRDEPRVKAAYQIMYECFLREAKVSEGSARTVNISEHGALLETVHAVEPDTGMILWILAPFYTMLVKGNVMHAHRQENGMYRIGVKLTDMIEGNWQVFKKDVETRAAEPIV
jgi:hypothetical protein